MVGCFAENLPVGMNWGAGPAVDLYPPRRAGYHFGVLQMGAAQQTQQHRQESRFRHFGGEDIIQQPIVKFCAGDIMKPPVRGPLQIESKNSGP